MRSRARLRPPPGAPARRQRRGGERSTSARSPSSPSRTRTRSSWPVPRRPWSWQAWRRGRGAPSSVAARYGLALSAIVHRGQRRSPPSVATRSSSAAGTCPVLGQIDVSAEALVEGAVLAGRVVVVDARLRGAVRQRRPGPAAADAAPGGAPLGAHGHARSPAWRRSPPATMHRLREAARCAGPAAAPRGPAGDPAPARRRVASTARWTWRRRSSCGATPTGLLAPRSPRPPGRRSWRFAISGVAAMASASRRPPDRRGRRARCVPDRCPSTRTDTTLALAAAIPLLAALPFAPAGAPGPAAEEACACLSRSQSRAPCATATRTRGSTASPASTCGSSRASSIVLAGRSGSGKTHAASCPLRPRPALPRRRGDRQPRGCGPRRRRARSGRSGRPCRPGRAGPGGAGGRGHRARRDRAAAGDPRRARHGAGPSRRGGGARARRSPTCSTGPPTRSPAASSSGWRWPRRSSVGPRLVLLDEPTSQLDPVAGDELIGLLRRLNEEWGTTVVLAEHRLERCLAAADRVVALDGRRDRLRRRAAGASSTWAAGHRPRPLATPGARLFDLAGHRAAPGERQAGARRPWPAWGSSRGAQGSAGRRRRTRSTPAATRRVQADRRSAAAPSRPPTCGSSSTTGSTRREVLRGVELAHRRRASAWR